MGFSMVTTELKDIFLILEFFAVRTMNEVTILSCYRLAGDQVSVEPCLTLPTTMSKATFSRSISDLAFDTLGSKVIVITQALLVEVAFRSEYKVERFEIQIKYCKSSSKRGDFT